MTFGIHRSGFGRQAGGGGQMYVLSGIEAGATTKFTTLGQLQPLVLASLLATVNHEALQLWEPPLEQKKKGGGGPRS